MKLVIMEMHVGPIIGDGNCHWVAFAPSDGMTDGFSLMGHKVIEVEEKIGSQILKSQVASIQLQMQLRDLCHPPVKKELQPPPLRGSSTGEPQ